MPARRTQAERRATTMQRLEEAAIRAMVECGVAHASTTEICRRAGVSRGALFQHYPTKADLLVASIERLFAQLVGAFYDELQAIEEIRLERALWLLWKAFANPEGVVVLELYAASRTDSDLRAVLSPMLDSHWNRMLMEAATVLPPAALSHPDLTSIVWLTIAAIQGASMGAVVEGHPPPQLARHFAFIANLFNTP